MVKINQIIVAKETREGEARVALTPAAVATLVTKNYRIMIESGAGILAGFTDAEYIQAGADMFTLGSTHFPLHSLFLRVKRPNKIREHLENELLPDGTVMMGFLDPFDVQQENHIANWQRMGIKPISLELLHLAADDPKNAQAAMSRFAGQLALQNALQHYQGSLPKRVSVLGTGPAGLSAAFAAIKQQLPVQLFGRHERHRQAVEREEITYYVLPVTEQRTFIRAHLSNETIIITAARNVGEKSPLLIDAASFEVLPDKAVIIDLSTGEGGNVEGSIEDQVVIIDRDISIINVSGYPKAEPQMASEAYAQAIVNLLLEIMIPNNGINLEHTLLRDFM